MGKDVEYWAGHFGTRFAQEKIIMRFSGASNSTSSNHIKQILGTRHLPANLPLSTNFNKSMGDKIFVNGKLVKSGIQYNNLNDADFNISYNNYVVPVDCSSEEKTAIAKGLIESDSSIEGFRTSKQVNAYPTSETAYNGTHCFEIKGKLDKNELALIKLYKTQYDNLKELNMSLVYCIKNNPKNVSFGLALRDSENKFSIMNVYQDNEANDEAKAEDPEVLWFKEELPIPKNLKSIRGVYLLVKNTSVEPIDIQIFGKSLLNSNFYI